MRKKSTAVYLIHECDEWATPLSKSLNKLTVPNYSWHMAERVIDLSVIPDDGIFYNRMSASAHTRGHRFAPELTAGLLSWLEANNCLVINGSNAIRLELSKINQYSAMKIVGIPVPKTIAATTLSRIFENLIKSRLLSNLPL